MDENVLIGRGREILSISREHWETQLRQAPARIKPRLDFMTRNHHRVRYFVVRELPRSGGPISPEFIASALRLSLARVNAILDELEARLFFLVRNKHGRVSWAFPVTVDKTPHKLKFSTGESVFAA
ncbi:MAG TPA: hypothetical protein VN743_04875 [Blastocatellia bacterium]|nr:hypothetical protein [Blastocatellia bacterium]